MRDAPSRVPSQLPFFFLLLLFCNELVRLESSVLFFNLRLRPPFLHLFCRVHVLRVIATTSFFAFPNLVHLIFFRVR